MGPCPEIPPTCEDRHCAIPSRAGLLFVGVGDCLEVISVLGAWAHPFQTGSFCKHLVCINCEVLVEGLAIAQLQGWQKFLNGEPSLRWDLKGIVYRVLATSCYRWKSLPCAQLASLSPLNGVSLKRDFILWLVCVETGCSAFPMCFLRAQSEVFITDKNSQRGELDKLFLFLLPKDIAFTIWKLCFQICLPLLNSSPSRAGNEHNSFCIIFAYHKTWHKTYSQSQIHYLKWNQSDVIGESKQHWKSNSLHRMHFTNKETEAKFSLQFSGRNEARV